MENQNHDVHLTEPSNGAESLAEAGSAGVLGVDPLAEPTDAEVDAALIAHGLQVVPLSRADMRKALTGFLRGRACGVPGDANG